MKKVFITLTHLIWCLVYTTGDGAATHKTGSVKTQIENVSEENDGLHVSIEKAYGDPNQTMELPGDCLDIYQNTSTPVSGIYRIRAVSHYVREFVVYCDMDTDGGGWTVIQRRDAKFQPRIDFNRGWVQYRDGFGKLDEEFWFGAELINKLTYFKPYELRVDLADFEGEVRYAKYSSFNVEFFNDNYQLRLGSYSGNAGDSMSPNDGQAFSTTLHDNDKSPTNCAYNLKGGWWYRACTLAHLNGLPYEGNYTGDHNGIYWFGWHGFAYSLNITEMKVRPIST